MLFVAQLILGALLPLTSSASGFLLRAGLILFYFLMHSRLRKQMAETGQWKDTALSLFPPPGFTLRDKDMAWWLGKRDKELSTRHEGPREPLSAPNLEKGKKKRRYGSRCLHLSPSLRVWAHNKGYERERAHP